jgi:hypothetical protein
VADAYNASYLGGKNKKDCSSRLTRAKSHISTNKSGMVVLIYDPYYVGGHMEKDCGLRPAPGKNGRPYLENN